VLLLSAISGQLQPERLQLVLRHRWQAPTRRLLVLQARLLLPQAASIALV
jgi:hypothetical protein